MVRYNNYYLIGGTDDLMGQFVPRNEFTETFEADKWYLLINSKYPMPPILAQFIKEDESNDYYRIYNGYSYKDGVNKPTKTRILGQLQDYYVSHTDRGYAVKPYDDIDGALNDLKTIFCSLYPDQCTNGGARRRSSGRKGRRSKRRSSGRRPRRSKRRSSGKKRRHRKGSCANKRKSRSCRNSKRCTWAKGRKGSRGHCRRSKNRK